MQRDELLSPTIRPNALGDAEAIGKSASRVFRRAEVLDGLRELTEDVLSTLRPREKEIVKMRFGLDQSGIEHTAKEVGAHFKITGRRFRQIEEKVLANLRHPSRSRRLRLLLDQMTKRTGGEASLADLREVVEKVSALTPELILHLQLREKDLEKIDPFVFEHLVAEFLMQRGFTNVRLVGRDSSTSADIYAVSRNNSIGLRTTYFVEVKGGTKRVGVEVVDRVYGAMCRERQRYVWDSALIVSVVGFKDFRKYTRRHLELMGIHLKGERDILMWLKEYQPNTGGRLWLPDPLRHLPHDREDEIS